MIQDILTVKIERNTYVNGEKAVSEIQILINKMFQLSVNKLYAFGKLIFLALK